VQNVAKIEQAAHHWIDSQVDMDDDNEEMRELRSPTLRELMEYEIDANVHDNSKLPRLKDKTAAMGLLWVRRQLQYQTALFANVIQVPAVFESTNAAVSAGYAEVYGKYHGWAVQKIFNYSFQSAPEPSEIFKVMNPHRLKEVLASLEAKGAGRISNNDKMNPLEKIGKHIGTEWDKLAGSVGSEWGKLADSVVRLFHDEPQQVNPTHGAAFVEQREETMYVDVNQLVAEEMQKDAFQNIDSFLHVVKPLLADLAGVFDELNMDDPSKV
jgi:Glycolipid transfer protein (GLTP)